MTQNVSVHLLPQLARPHELQGSVAVVIDVLRASTTIIHALANGAAAVIPCETVDEAWKLKQSLAEAAGTDEHVLLGGERHGVRIDGFDLGNSPLDYTAGVAAGKTIVFTTTNGTRALRYCTEARRVFIGAFVNHAALTRILQKEGRPIHLVCAGTNGHLTAEDILLAGAAATELVTHRSAGKFPVVGNDLLVEAVVPYDVQTQMAIDFYQARAADVATFRETVRSSRGGQNLRRLSMEADIERAMQFDLFDVVPEWRADENRIVPTGQT